MPAGRTRCGPRSWRSRARRPRLLPGPRASGPRSRKMEALMGNDLFRRQLGLYAAVHRDWRNKATHFVGIPVIVFSLLLILSMWPTALLVVAVIAVLGWLALDVGIGLVMAVLMALACYAAWALAGALGSPQAVWIAFLALFVGGWILQFLGHHY